MKYGYVEFFNFNFLAKTKYTTLNSLRAGNGNIRYKILVYFGPNGSSCFRKTSQVNRPERLIRVAVYDCIVPYRAGGSARRLQSGKTYFRSIRRGTFACQMSNKRQSTSCHFFWDFDFPRFELRGILLCRRGVLLVTIPTRAYHQSGPTHGKIPP